MLILLNHSLSIIDCYIAAQLSKVNYMLIANSIKHNNQVEDCGYAPLDPNLNMC